MLKVDLENKKFVELLPILLGEAGFKECQDLQTWIFNSPDKFFGEIAEDLLILEKECKPSEDVMDRIDLLAIDRLGVAVIIELKRGSNKWQLSQALAYAAMISKWGRGNGFLESVIRHVKNADCDAIKKFLQVDLSELNQTQRVLMVVEEYDYEVLVTTAWLNEIYKVNITCCQLSLARDESSGSLNVSATRIYPATDPTDLAVTRRGTADVVRTKTWDERLADCENNAVRQFFRERLQGRRTANDVALAFPASGTIHWCAEVRPQRAFITQIGRFHTTQMQKDEDLWRERLSQADLGYLRNGTNLRFYLVTSEDFDFFTQTVQGAGQFKWLKSGSVTGNGAEGALEQDRTSRAM